MGYAPGKNAGNTGPMGMRSAADHAGIPAVQTVHVNFGTATTGHRIAAAPNDGRTIRLLGWKVTFASTSLCYFNISSSSTDEVTVPTSLTGQMGVGGGSDDYLPDPTRLNGIAQCNAGEDLCISAANSTGNALITYSLVP